MQIGLLSDHLNSRDGRDGSDGSGDGGGGGRDGDGVGVGAISPERMREAVNDLDQFFTSVYRHCQLGGMTAMLLSECGQIGEIGVTAAFVGFLSWTHWSELFRCAPDCVFPFHPFPSLWGILIMSALGCYVVYKSILLVRHIRSGRSLLACGLSFDHTCWEEVVSSLVCSSKLSAALVHTLTVTDCCAIVNRWDDLVASVLIHCCSTTSTTSTSTPSTSTQWIMPGIGVDVSIGPSTWAIVRRVLTTMLLDRHIQHPRMMVRQIRKWALLWFCAAPVTMIYTLLSRTIQLAHQLHRNPQGLMGRQVSARGRLYHWLWNEMPHLAETRLRIAAQLCPAAQWHPIVRIVARLIWYTASTFLIWFVCMALLSPQQVMNLTLAQHTLWWWFGLVGALVAVLHNSINTPLPDRADIQRSMDRFCSAVGTVPPSRSLSVAELQCHFPTVLNHCIADVISCVVAPVHAWIHADALARSIQSLQTQEQSNGTVLTCAITFQNKNDWRTTVSMIHRTLLCWPWNNWSDMDMPLTKIHALSSDVSQFQRLFHRYMPQQWTPLQQTIFQTQTDSPHLNTTPRTTLVGIIEQMRAHCLDQE